MTPEQEQRALDEVAALVVSSREPYLSEEIRGIFARMAPLHAARRRVVEACKKQAIHSDGHLPPRVQAAVDALEALEKEVGGE